MKQRERLDKMQPTDCETKVEIDSTNEKKIWINEKMLHKMPLVRRVRAIFMPYREISVFFPSCSNSHEVNSTIASLCENSFSNFFCARETKIDHLPVGWLFSH